MSLTVDDLIEIQNTVHSYPFLLDAGRFDELGELFADAVVYNGDAILADRNAQAYADTFRQWLLLYDGRPCTRHMLANVMLEPQDNGDVVVRSYVMVFQQTDALPLQPVIGGDYRDTLRKLDGRWRFVERRMGNDLVGDLSAHGKDTDAIQRLHANDRESI